MYSKIKKDFSFLCKKNFYTKLETNNIRKLALRSMLKDWKNSVGTFITFTATAIILNLFVLLSITAFRESALAEKSKLDNYEGPMMMFMIIGGIVIIMSIITLSLIIGLTIKKRNNYYKSFRILGLQHKQLKLSVNIENWLMLIVATLIGFPISIPTTMYTTKFLKKYYVLEPAWKTNYTWWYFALTFVILLFISWIVVSKCMKTFKNINSTQKEKSHRRLMWRKYTGITLGVVAITMFFVKFVMYGDMGSGMIINAIMALAGSIMLIGPDVFKFFLNKWALMFKKSSTMFIAFKSLSYAAGMLVSPLCMIISGTLTIIASTQLNGILGEAKLKYAGPTFNFVESGIQFEKQNREVFWSDEITNIYNNTSHTTFISNQISVLTDKTPINDNENEVNFFTQSILSKDSTFFYNVKTLKGNLEKLFTNEQNIIVSNDSNCSVGDSVGIYLNKQLVKFDVVGIYSKPFIGDVLPMAFINANYLISNQIENFKVSKIVSTTNELNSLHNKYIPYDPYEELVYASSIGKNISLLFAIVIGTYIMIGSITAISSYVTSKKKLFKLQRIILNTPNEIWKQLLIEMTLFVIVATTIICSFSLLFCLMFSWANGVPGIITTMPLLFLITILLEVVIVIGSYLIPIAFLRNDIRKIKRN